MNFDATVTGQRVAEISAVAAAFAAFAAWANVLTAARRDARNRRPLLYAHLLVGATPHPVEIEVTNVGLGPAIAPTYLAVHKGRAYAGSFRRPILGAGDKATVRLDAGRPGGWAAPPMIVTCRGVDGRTYWTTGDERSFSRTVSRWRPRSFHRWPDSVTLFEEAYPEVSVPDDALRARAALRSPGRSDPGT